MIRSTAAGALGVLLVAVSLVGTADVNAAHAQPPEPAVVAGFDLTTPVARWELPGRLREISGLAVTGVGRVLAHGDEEGRLTELDYHGGTVIRDLQMGAPVVRGDFEGIELVGRQVTLMTSDGRLFSAALPDAGSVLSPVTITDTGLGGRCELEGLALSRDGAWLLPCKVPRRRTKDLLFSVYAWSPTMAGIGQPRLMIPLGTQKRQLGPSAIAMTPAGTFLLLFGPDHAVGEFSSAGTPLALVSLPARAHPQPEGLAITPDGFLLIADEGSGPQHGQLTVYGPPR